MMGVRATRDRAFLLRLAIEWVTVLLPLLIVSTAPSPGIYGFATTFYFANLSHYVTVQPLSVAISISVVVKSEYPIFPVTFIVCPVTPLAKDVNNVVRAVRPIFALLAVIESG